MTIKPEKKYNNPAGILLLAVIIIALSVSCKSYKDQSDHRNLIPEKTFVSILTDVYIADGLLSLPEFRNMFAKRDSVANYIDIIEGYGYSYETMNKTVNYYFINKPKKLIRIYDQVIKNLSEMQSGFQEAIAGDIRVESDKMTETNSYYLPDTRLNKQPGFEYNLGSSGFFTLSFTVTVYPDDQTVNPCLTYWYYNSDSIENGKRYYLPSVKYVKNGHRITYSITDRIKDTGQYILKGFFYDCENNPNEWEKHARIENITFSFTGMMPV